MEAAFAASDALVERITALDRSTSPFTNQISAAAKLASLVEFSKQSLCSHQPDINQDLSNHKPTDEWVLRWLLKGLQLDGIQDGHPCTIFGSWTSFAQLVKRIPAKVLARDLQNSLIVPLLGTLKWLEETLSAHFPPKQPASTMPNAFQTHPE